MFAAVKNWWPAAMTLCALIIPCRTSPTHFAGCDLQALGFDKARSHRTGRPDYDPANLLKICQYGYVQRNRHVH